MPITKQYVKDYKIVTNPDYIKMIERIDENLLRGVNIYYLYGHEYLNFVGQAIRDYELAGWKVELKQDDYGQDYLEFS